MVSSWNFQLKLPRQISRSAIISRSPAISPVQEILKKFVLTDWKVDVTGCTWDKVYLCLSSCIVILASISSCSMTWFRDFSLAISLICCSRRCISSCKRLCSSSSCWLFFFFCRNVCQSAFCPFGIEFENDGLSWRFYSNKKIVKKYSVFRNVPPVF